MSNEHYDAAVTTFMLEPEALTPEQIDVLTKVDTRLGTRAIRKRDEALQKAAAVRHAKSMGVPAPPKQSDREELVDAVVDQLLLQVGPARSRIKTLEEQNDTLDERCRALESRVLELEAVAASWTVPRVEH